jgi:hypothetical protein
MMLMKREGRDVLSKTTRAILSHGSLPDRHCQ